jgi:DNA-directed RNA polymerase sigma subunit (sigma70/sigma32)
MAEPMTLREIADELGISISEALRIERQALRKLKKMPEAKILCLYLARFEMAIQPEEY